MSKRRSNWSLSPRELARRAGHDNPHDAIFFIPFTGEPFVMNPRPRRRRKQKAEMAKLKEALR